MSPRIWSVGDLTRRIKDLLETDLDQVWVQGEISGLKIHPSSGHAYFSLKDERAVLGSVLWATNLRRLTHRPVEGMRVRAFGRISVYEPRGIYQFYVEQLLPDGEGALQAAFLKLKRQLEAEGLFDPARKRPLPRYPRRIGIVTSPSGAALRDMLRIFRRRWPSLEVWLRPAAVQGAGAALDLAEGIRDLNRLGPEHQIDLLIVGRGGGSLEDLWAFNEEALARAVHASALPVISAVGHEVDFTICDFVADVRAATPTHAAELATPDQEEVGRVLARDDRFLRQTLQQKLREARLGLERLRMSRGLRQPQQKIIRGRLDVDRVADRLRSALAARAEGGRVGLRDLHHRLFRISPELLLASLTRRLEGLGNLLLQAQKETHRRRRTRLEITAARLAALGPEQVLERGYCIARRGDGTVLTSALSVDVGDTLGLWLHQGQLRCKVEERWLESSKEARG